MTKKIKKKILLIFDDVGRENELKELLGHKNYDFVKSKNISKAITILNNDKKIYFVIIDSILGYKKSISDIKKLKKYKKSIGILLLINDLSNKIIYDLKKIEGLYISSFEKNREHIVYLVENYFFSLKKVIANSGVSKFVKYEKKIYVIPNSIKFIKPISEHLTRDLANVGIVNSDYLINVKFGIQEMIINAIEHGNLEISYEQKSEMLTNGIDLNEIIKKYSKNERYKNRKVIIKYILTKNSVKYVIKDQGNGFNWRKIPDCSNDENYLLEHGRGIMMTKNYFDKFYYNEKGNEVTMVIYKKGD